MIHCLFSRQSVIYRYNIDPVYAGIRTQGLEQDERDSPLYQFAHGLNILQHGSGKYSANAIGYKFPNEFQFSFRFPLRVTENNPEPAFLRCVINRDSPDP
jgi:hypothetical protein